MDDVLSRLLEIGVDYAPITDRASTFGWFKWSKACAKAGVAPVFGVELAVSDDIGAKKPSSSHWTFIATDDIAPLNELVEKATMQFRYQPLLTLEQALEASERCQVVLGNNTPIAHIEKALERDIPLLMAPSTPKAIVKRFRGAAGVRWVGSGDNRFVRPSDLGAYQVVMGRQASTQTYPQHILDSDEWRESVTALGFTIEETDEALANSRAICESHTAELRTAHLPVPPKPATLREMCEEMAPKLGCDLSDPVYQDRLTRELDLIETKGYEDYFYIVLDICKWARERMSVGPARGSSCGSLVCYLLEITTVDPIPFGLIFERFIDINRDDMPDIDIDFSDQNRHLVFEYINQKYGPDYCARLGTVTMYQPRSILNEAGAALKIPKWKCDNVADTLIERSSADSRALSTLMDTLETMPAGKTLLGDHPEFAGVTCLEGHPRHYSQHAAGVVIASEPITNYVAVDHRTGATMCDKKDAEDGYNLLKIDALGLKQLSVFEDALDMIGLPKNFLETLPLDDPAAFEVINKRQWSGIFQFNGLALQSLATQTKVDCFDDIVAITALARPGPLTSGGAERWCARKNGAKIEYPHPLFEPYMKDTYGVVMFQEQVMEIGREIGDLTWGDVTALRKAMSKSLGKEFFDKFGDKWKDAAEKKGIPRAVLDPVWTDLCAYGSWAFNKSHSVAYGMISYWCCWLKAHHPFEFAAATLTHEKEASKQLFALREMAAEGYGYVPVDAEKSTDKWSAGEVDGKKVLVGPVQNVKGIGPKLVQQIMSARARSEPLPSRAQKLLDNPKTPIDDLYPIKSRIAEIMPDPTERNIHTVPTPVGEVTEDHKEEITVLLFAVVRTIQPRDENDPIAVAKRGYEITRGPTDSLSMQLEDDSGTIYTKISRWDYGVIAKDIIDRGRAGKAIYAFKGECMANRRFMFVKQVKYIGDMEND